MIKPNKLVRDKMPQIIEEEGRDLDYEVLSGSDLDSAIRNKLQEELDEVLEATSKSNLKEELADLLTVMKKFAENEDISWGDVENEYIRKGFDRGFFDKNIKLNYYSEEK